MEMTVVFSKDLNESGTAMRRVAEIDGQFYPYHFSLNTAQVTWGNEFARHSAEGVRYVSEPCATLDDAKIKLGIIPRGRDGGRPPIMDEPGKRRQITATDDVWEWLKAHGDDNASEGLRRLYTKHNP